MEPPSKSSAWDPRFPGPKTAETLSVPPLGLVGAVSAPSAPISSAPTGTPDPIGWSRTGFPYWIIRPNILGSIIPYQPTMVLNTAQIPSVDATVGAFHQEWGFETPRNAVMNKNKQGNRRFDKGPVDVHGFLDPHGLE